jgi:hypothetical protein
LVLITQIGRQSDFAICTGKSLANSVLDISVRRAVPNTTELLREHLDCYLACSFAGRKSPHTVSDNEDTTSLIREKAVFVVCPVLAFP